MTKLLFILLLLFGCSPTEPEDFFVGIFILLERLSWALGITIILLIVSVSINIYQYKKSRKGAFKTAKTN